MAEQKGKIFPTLTPKRSDVITEYTLQHSKFFSKNTGYI